MFRDKAGILLVCGLGCHNVAHIGPDDDHYYGRDDKGHRHLGPDPRRLSKEMLMNIIFQGKDGNSYFRGFSCICIC